MNSGKPLFQHPPAKPKRVVTTAPMTRPTQKRMYMAHPALYGPVLTEASEKAWGCPKISLDLVI